MALLSLALGIGAATRYYLTLERQVYDVPQNIYVNYEMHTWPSHVATKV